MPLLAVPKMAISKRLCHHKHEARSLPVAVNTYLSKVANAETFQSYMQTQFLTLLQGPSAETNQAAKAVRVLICENSQQLLSSK